MNHFAFNGYTLINNYLIMYFTSTDDQIGDISFCYDVEGSTTLFNVYEFLKVWDDRCENIHFGGAIFKLNNFSYEPKDQE